jgi:predicted metal-dependent phosphoesterase TrpH
MRGEVAVEGNPWSVGDVADVGGGWFRGNVHCHTTESDGRLAPRAAAEWFAGAGYDFLALTDHNRVTDPAVAAVDGLCLLRAAEVTATGGELGAQYHLIALGLPEGFVLPAPSTPAAESARRLREAGAAVFIAHPHWSGLTVADLRAVDATGVEVFNGGTVLDSQKGEATAYWDEGLARGSRWWGIAVDDTHWHSVDRGLGWVVVRAAEPTPPALLRAIARGHFYASAGPEIRHVALAREPDGGATVAVECSPCAAIYALGFGSRNQFTFDREAIARGETGATVTRGTFKIAPATIGGQRHPYVRVQCVDWQRRSAWSNPLFL